MFYKNFRRSVSAITLAFSCIVPAAGYTDSYLVAEAAGWQIGFDTENSGCFAYGEYENGLTLKFGYNPLQDLLEFSVGSQNWNSIEPGKEYELKTMFGQDSPWTGTFIGGREQSGLSFLHAATTDARMIQAFMRKRNLTLIFEGREIAKLSLQGSYRAFEVVMACQKNVMEQLAAPNPEVQDPFSNRATVKDISPKSSDPFL